MAAYMPDVGEGMFPTHKVPVPESLTGLWPAENPDLNPPAAFHDGDATNPETGEAISRPAPQTVRADFEVVTRTGRRTTPNSCRGYRDSPVEFRDTVRAERTVLLRPDRTGFLHRRSEEFDEAVHKTLGDEQESGSTPSDPDAGADELRAPEGHFPLPSGKAAVRLDTRVPGAPGQRHGARSHASQAGHKWPTSDHS
ncbi:hypothetical protein [Streptosporangium vulgare]|uniref:Uncharacterized protein n=1 Tax=Streptosporangium vulgare TaxID=46190 RepID=A0ABV5TLS1_9ACTN